MAAGKPTLARRIGAPPAHRIFRNMPESSRYGANPSPTHAHASGSLKPADDPQWDEYSRTILEIFDDPPLRIPVWQPLGDPEIEELTARGLTPPFAVVTASNPRGRVAADADNARRNGELRRALDELGAIVWPADGVSIDGDHRERGFAATIGREAAREIAVRFDQSAFYWCDGRGVWLFGAVVETEPVRLGRGG
jgi:hypothetical protein